MEKVSQSLFIPVIRWPWREYYQMTKPKVVMMLLLTAVVGMCLAQPGPLPLVPMVAGLVGIGLLSSAAAVINHIVDRQIDSRMARTYHRPLPQGRIAPRQALYFALLLAVLGYICLECWVNRMTALLTLSSMLGYAVLYTMYLKRATPQNIVIGGLAGASPPLLGWTSMTNSIDASALLLVLIIYTWTPPHFWALSIHRYADYARVNVPMLPVTHGIEYTKTSVFLYTILLALVCLLPYLVGMTGTIYLIGSTGLNLVFIYHSWKLKYADQPGQAMRTFRFSIVHLMLLFMVLLADHYW